MQWQLDRRIWHTHGALTTPTMSTALVVSSSNASAGESGVPHGWQGSLDGGSAKFRTAFGIWGESVFTKARARATRVYLGVGTLV